MYISSSSPVSDRHLSDAAYTSFRYHEIRARGLTEELKSSSFDCLPKDAPKSSITRRDIPIYALRTSPSQRGSIFSSHSLTSYLCLYHAQVLSCSDTQTPRHWAVTYHVRITASTMPCQNKVQHISILEFGPPNSDLEISARPWMVAAGTNNCCRVTLCIFKRRTPFLPLP